MSPRLGSAIPRQRAIGRPARVGRARIVELNALLEPAQRLAVANVAVFGFNPSVVLHDAPDSGRYRRTTTTGRRCCPASKSWPTSAANGELPI
jgi:hypothetical protein